MDKNADKLLTITDQLNDMIYNADIFSFSLQIAKDLVENWVNLSQVWSEETPS